MRYSSPDEWLRYLEAIHPSGIDLGLERVARVAARLDCIKPAPLVILVGGTNGKGTTSALIAALLRKQGKRIGMYNSPHIHRYNERVSVDGADISDANLCRSFEAVERARDDITLTYFEFGTLAALWHFKQQSLDAVVLEIGLGGRLDAVNVVDPDISVVTSIGLDHQDWLGNTVDEIAYEKCSIARAGKWLVCGQPDAPARALATVKNLGGYFAARGDMFDVAESEQQLIVSYTANNEPRTVTLAEYHIPHHNVATAIQVLALIDQLPPSDVLSETVSGLRVPGRWQSWSDGSAKVVLDVAHNPQAAAYLRHHIEELDCLVLGMLSDKDVAGVLEALPPFKRLYVVTLTGWRGLDREELGAKSRAAGFTVDQSFETMSAALESIPATGTTLVAGSFHTVEAAAEWLKAGEGKWNSI
ncbi:MULTISPECIES: bifunctional tetrahydrofolate synthase/dihydrofolate synthase [unclassified Thalassolituus]|jgi:dihydrofolate synthase/folylpolyglutamate synthase|uniref:bifunctional tetrahydrofolate synthase/dihydrofolate synthase n=1 Tax=unclassified Thalassolituus TaxID=2624967 RepID=UPI000B6596B5|nr:MULTISPECIES: bifunctional tetrahydrofolate synthase/dihydrofolate synthase [unclassified Thalassolituus]MBN58857.1 bifunctional tetrahydrofolate synthase/dihydrofolate synthase [Oceanospirillaceae bacterium]MDQ4427397.1 bifunctional tetrahydrofolate synthase/dihydrofolate synthase [Thalassolituus sp.]OUX66274.1 MAG: bifunctional tetrahydrofolate synthase/dihydrofolate synthase [Oceanospirillaceae bacterium TMED276]|tara:strand:- start:1145 stop:2395 length:1251 start_codon:yes stop_codon:yes gene_type:complete